MTASSVKLGSRMMMTPGRDFQVRILPAKGVDSHELIALCAPCPVFFSAGSLEPGDGWVDAKGTFMAAAAAGPIYKLLGKKDLGTTEFPPMETALLTGDLGFRQHSAGHTDAPNWSTFLEFAVPKRQGNDGPRRGPKNNGYRGSPRSRISTTNIFIDFPSH
jgi:hypothetical protein